MPLSSQHRANTAGFILRIMSGHWLVHMNFPRPMNNQDFCNFCWEFFPWQRFVCLNFHQAKLNIWQLVCTHKQKHLKIRAALWWGTARQIPKYPLDYRAAPCTSVFQLMDKTKQVENCSTFLSLCSKMTVFLHRSRKKIQNKKLKLFCKEKHLDCLSR